MKKLNIYPQQSLVDRLREVNINAVLRLELFIATIFVLSSIVVIILGRFNMYIIEEKKDYPNIASVRPINSDETLLIEERARKYVMTFSTVEGTSNINSYKSDIVVSPLKKTIPEVEVSEEEVLQVPAETTDSSVSVDANYCPTEEERQWAYFMAFAEAGIEDPFGQTLVIDVAINSMRENGYSNLIEEFTANGRYSSVKNGVPSVIVGRNEEGKAIWKPVTEEDLSDSLKDAVDDAFEKDYTEELLKQALGTRDLPADYYEGGALYFYNPKAISAKASSERANILVSFQYGRHVFYRVWDR